MVSILFVCHGNICRSAAAEMIMKDLLHHKNAESRMKVWSAATTTEEIGNDIYPPMKRTLRSHGIPCFSHAAKKMTYQDYSDADLVLVMDDENMRDVLNMIGNENCGKVHYLMEYTGKTRREVSDPWYTRDFEKAFQDILEGCEGLLESLDI